MRNYTLSIVICLLLASSLFSASTVGSAGGRDYANLNAYYDTEGGYLGPSNIDSALVYADASSYDWGTTDINHFTGNEETGYTIALCADGEWHEGTVGAGVVLKNSTGHCFTVNIGYSRLKRFEIDGGSNSGNSNECIRITASTGNNDSGDFYCDYMLFHDWDDADQDGIYIGANDGAFTVKNSAFWNFGRVAINLQAYAGTGVDQWCRIENVSVINAGLNNGSSTAGCLFFDRQAASGGQTAIVTNSYFDHGSVVLAGYDDLDENGSTISVTWTGNDNLFGSEGVSFTLSAGEDLTGYTVTQTTGLSAGSWIVVTDTTGADVDLTLVNDAQCDAIDGGDTRPVADDWEEDTRDAAGSVDIGADEFVAAPAAAAVVRRRLVISN
jgi:hypothetical protein